MGILRIVIISFYILINNYIFDNFFVNFALAEIDNIQDNVHPTTLSKDDGQSEDSVSEDSEDSASEDSEKDDTNVRSGTVPKPDVPEDDHTPIYEPYEGEDDSVNENDDVIGINTKSTQTDTPPPANQPPTPTQPPVQTDSAANFPVSEIVRQAYLDAVNFASRYWHMELLPLHLAAVIFWNPQSIGGIWLHAAGGDHQRLINIITEKLKEVVVTTVQTSIKLSEQFARYRNKVKEISLSYGMQVIKYDHIVEGFLYEADVWYCLSFAGVTRENLLEVLNAARMSPEEKKLHAPLRLPVLTLFSTNITELVRAGKGQSCIARHQELQQMIETMMRMEKSSVLIKGEPGIGKSTLVHGLAARIISGDVPRSMRNNVIIELSLTKLFAARKHQAEFDNNYRAILKEIKSSNNRVILYIDDFHTLIGGERGAVGGMDFITVLKRAITRGMKLIVETTNKDFTALVAAAPFVGQKFVVIALDPPTEEDVLLMCRAKRNEWTAFYQIHIPDKCFRFAYKLSRTFPRASEPTSTYDLLHQSLSHVRTQNENRPAIIDSLERRTSDLKLQLANLSDATDLITQSKVKKMEQQLKAYEEELIPLKDQHNGEYIRYQAVKDIKTKIATLQQQAEQLRFHADQTQRVEIQYKHIPELQAELMKAAEELRNFRSNYKESLIKDELVIEDIAEIVASQNHLSAHQLTATTDGSVEYCMEMFDRNVVGFQPEKKHVCDRFSMRKAGILQNNKPITTILLVGPTGVGKTWFAREVATKIAMGESLCRLDMSEFSSRETVSSLMGAAPGLVGHEENSYLVDCVRAHPACVVLLDEMEKAHKEVLTHFLQIMDIGQMKDNKGNVVDFTNTILIWTSNIGSDHYAAVGDENDPDYSNRIMQAKLNIRRELRSRLAPEFLQRMQLIKIIEPLKKKESKLIFKHKLVEMAKHLHNLMLIEVKMADEAVDIVIDHVFDPLNGARIFQRWIDDNVLSIIAKQINANIILPNCRVIIRKSKSSQESLVLTIIPRDDEGKPIPGADKTYKMPPARNMIS